MSYKNLGILLIVLFILVLAAACPERPSVNPTPEGRPVKGLGEAPKVITVADIDVAGTNDKELAEIAGKIMDAKGMFVASDKLQKGEWEALKAKVVAKEPAPFAFYLLAGIENSLSAGSAGAIDAAQKAAGAAPNSAWANGLLGHVLSSGGRDDEALVAFKKAETLSSKTTPSPYLSAASGRDDEVMRGGRDEEVMGAGGRDEELLGVTRKGELASMGKVRYMDHAPAIEYSKKAGGKPPKPESLGLPGFEDAELAAIEAKLLTAQGYFYRDKSIAEADWKSMMEKLRAKAEAGKNALASYLYAGALVVEKDTIDSPQLKTALAQAQKSVELAKNSPRAHYLLGFVQEMAGASTKAMDELKKSVNLDPLYAAPHFAMAEVYERMGDRKGAVSELKAVISLKGVSDVEKQSAEAWLRQLEKAK